MCFSIHTIQYVLYRIHTSFIAYHMMRKIEKLKCIGKSYKREYGKRKKRLCFFFVIEIGMKIMSADIIHSSQVLKCVQDSICVEFVYYMKHVVFIQTSHTPFTFFYHFSFTQITILCVMLCFSFSLFFFCCCFSFGSWESKQNRNINVYMIGINFLLTTFYYSVNRSKIILWKIYRNLFFVFVLSVFLCDKIYRASG